MFITFRYSNRNDYEDVYLIFRRWKMKENRMLTNILRFYCLFLSAFWKDMSNVVALIGDNCSVHQSSSTKPGVSLIFCATHHFELTVKKILYDHENIVKQVHNRMVKTWNHLMLAKLQRLTPVEPQIWNETRSRSTYQILRRHVELRQFVPSLHCYAFNEMLLTKSAIHKVD